MKEVPEKKHDADRTRAKLLAAADKSFVEKGFDAARVDEIAMAAGANKRLIYLYFGSKKDLYHEVLRTNLARMLEANLDVMTTAEGDPRKLLKRSVRRFFNFLEANQGFVRLLTWVSLSFDRNDKRHRELARILAEGLDDMVELIRRGADDGYFRKDIRAEMLVFSVIGLCITYFQRRMLMEALWKNGLRTQVDREEALAHILSLVFEGILPPDARAGAKRKGA